MEISQADASKQQNEQSTDDDTVEGLKGVRLSTVMMLILWAAAIVFRSINMDWTTVECNEEFDDDQADELCIRYSSIYRTSTVAILIMILQGLFAICSVRVYDDFWILKFALLFGFTACFVLLEADFFNDDGFIWIARIGGFIFIVLQASILLDFAYYWNQSWMDKSGVMGQTQAFVIESSDCYQGCKSIWLVGLMVMSFVYAAIFAVTMGVLYHFYGGKGCGDNVSIITVSLVLTLVAIAVQLMGQNGSIIASGIVAVYVSYLTYVAVSLNPDEDCNPSIGSQQYYGIGQFAIGIVVSLISIVWVSVITSRRIASLLSNNSFTNVGVASVIQGRHSGTKHKSVEHHLEKHTRVAVINLSFVCILICFYISMILTNWGTITKDSETDRPTSGRTSMWMQAIGAWAAIALYTVGLILPHFKILPDNIWELKFNFSGAENT